MRVTLALLAFGLVSASIAGDPPLKTVTEEVAKTWESLGPWTISRDGGWIAATINRIDADGRLTVKKIDGSGAFEIPNGSGAIFSPDGTYLAYRVSPPKAVADKLRNERKPVETTLVLRNLADGKETKVENVATFRFLKTGPFVYRRTPAEGTKDNGAEMGLIVPATGETLVLPGVTDWATNKAEDLLALATSTDRQTRSVVLLDPATRVLRPLTSGADDVDGLVFAEKSDVLAYLLGKETTGKAGEDNRIVFVTDLRTAPKIRTLEPQKADNFPKGERVIDAAGLELSKDGRTLRFGIGKWRPTVKPDPLASNVEIWNTADLLTPPQQRVNAPRDADAAATAIWRLDAPTFRIVDKALETTAIGGLETGRALVNDEAPYRKAASDGLRRYDVKLRDVVGDAPDIVLASGLLVPGRVSPTGKYVLTFDAGRWTTYDGRTGAILATTPTGFANERDDHTVPQKPPAGGPFWLRDDDGFLLRDEFDLWRFGPSGFVKITDGRRRSQEFSAIDPLPDDGELPTFEGLAIGDFHRPSKNGGWGFIKSGRLVPLAGGPWSFGPPRFSEVGDRNFVVMQSEVSSPGIYAKGPDAPGGARALIATNPQQAEYGWTKARVVDYKSRWGLPLQGTLRYPANYVAGRQYPMITYIYERLSDEAYTYDAPNPFVPYSAGDYTQRGYFVFEPDIAYYRAGRPGEDAVDCLEPAVAAAAKAEPGIDASRVGLIGHSWGGYQTAFVTSVSKTFKVGVAGAPLTDLVGMANTHYWNVGMPNQPILETSQGRMLKPFYDDMEGYIRNSPIWRSKERKAPILVAHGDQDGAVDYHQGVALYNTLRRLGKPAVLLLYPGENHGLAKKTVREDYARRMRHYLDVYLKNLPAEEWVTKPTTVLDGREASGKKG